MWKAGRFCSMLLQYVILVFFGGCQGVAMQLCVHCGFLACC